MSTNASASELAPSTVAPPAPTVWETMRQFPRPVWCLFLGMFINRFGTFVLPFLALHVTAMGYPAAAGGFVLGMFGAGHLLAAVLGGHLADTCGPRRTIMASMVCGAITMLLLSQARSLEALAVVAFLNGLTGELYRPASSALLADLVPEDGRVTAYAAYRFAINAGFAIGPAVGGMLAGRSYQWLFLGDATTSLLYGCVALAWLPRDRVSPVALGRMFGGAGASVWQAVELMLKDGRFRRLTAATFAVAMVFMQLFTTLGLELRAAGFSPLVYGLILGLNGALIVLLEIPATGVTRRYDPRVMIGTGFAFIGLGAALFRWADAPWDYAVAMAVCTAGEIVSMPVAMAYAAGMAPPGLRGRVLGLYGLTWAAAMTVGPALGSAVFSVSRPALWLGCGVAGVLGGLLMMMPLRGHRGGGPG